MNHWIKESMENVSHVIKKSNIVIINEQEAIMITKNNNIPAALEKITNILRNHLKDGNLDDDLMWTNSSPQNKRLYENN